MPKYDFKCNECGMTIEVTTKNVMVSGELLKDVPCLCGGEYEKVFSAKGQSGKAGDTPKHYK